MLKKYVTEHIILLIIISVVLIGVSLFVLNNSQNDIATSNTNSNGANTSQEQVECVDWSSYAQNANQLVEKSTIIGQANVLDSYTEIRGDMVFTKSIVEIKSPEMIKKSAINRLKERNAFSQGKKAITIEILQTGGTYGDMTTESFIDAPLLEIGKRYMLFLESTDEGHYLITAGYRGIAEINDNKVVFINNVNKDDFPNFEGLHVDNMAKEIYDSSINHNDMLIRGY